MADEPLATLADVGGFNGDMHLFLLGQQATKRGFLIQAQRTVEGIWTIEVGGCIVAAATEFSEAVTEALRAVEVWP